MSQKLRNSHARECAINGAGSNEALQSFTSALNSRQVV